jgi:O-antigen ligase
VIVATADARPIVWGSPIIRFVLALFPLWCTAGVVFLSTPWQQKLIVGGVAAVTLASPAAGLLAVTALTPFGAILEGLTHLPFRFSEEVVLAFLGAWLVRATADGRGPRVPPAMAAAGWLLAVSAVTSVAVLTYGFSHEPGQSASVTIWLRQAYYIAALPIGFVDAMRLIEGLALVAATSFVFRQRPSLAVSLPVALCTAAAAAAVLAVLTHYGAGPQTLVDAYAPIGYRAAHIFDPNAAGSYFAMLLCLALGMTLRARIGAWWLVATACIAMGLLFSESRSAMAAVAVAMALATMWMLTPRWRLRRRVATAAGLLTLGIAATFVRARLLELDPTFQGGGFRTQFNESSLRIIAARPLAGVGIGQYYATSALFLTPQMAWTYGHENAHNFFLQTGAELGVPGLLLVVVYVGAALMAIARGIVRSDDPRLLGGGAGVAVMLATCLTGHPLLVYEVAFPFWIQLGLTLALAQSAVMNASAAALCGQYPSVAPGRVRAVSAVAAAILVAVVATARAPIDRPAETAVTGLYPWETAADGTRFRWTGRYASVFVPAAATRVDLLMRVPTTVRAVAPMGVEIAHAGVMHTRALIGPEWVRIEVPLTEAEPGSPYKRIDVKVDRVWQPAIYIPGSADLRHVGVQMGECVIDEWSGPPLSARGC